jgi:DNA-binding transcriptional ArsR family regulator
MAELDLIAPPKTVTVTFSLEPAYNVVNSLLLLQEVEETSGFSEWVYQTADALPPERLHTNRVVLSGLDASGHLAGASWPSFPAWVDDLETRDPVSMRDDELRRFTERAGELLEDEVPSPSKLLADRAAYLSLIKDIHRCKGHTYDAAVFEEAHGLLNDPPAMQDLIVAHLRAMWDEVMAAEWERTLPTLEESVAAYESLGLENLPLAEALRRVTDRELPEGKEYWLTDVEQIIFIPSPHIGPYLMGLDLTDGTQRLAFGARIPEGAAVSSLTLSHSELLMRLNALADDTRMRILKLLAEKGELSTPEIMAELDLSQSAASRHLHQLSATGYLTARRQEGAKFYRLNVNRIDHTCAALKEFCCP